MLEAGCRCVDAEVWRCRALQAGCRRNKWRCGVLEMGCRRNEMKAASRFEGLDAGYRRNVEWRNEGLKARWGRTDVEEWNFEALESLCRCADMEV